MTARRFAYFTRHHDAAHVHVATYEDEPATPSQEKGMVILYKTELAGEMRDWPLERLRTWFIANAEAGTLAASNMVPPARKKAGVAA